MIWRTMPQTSTRYGTDALRMRDAAHNICRAAQRPTRVFVYHALSLKSLMPAPSAADDAAEPAAFEESRCTVSSHAAPVMPAMRDETA